MTLDELRAKFDATHGTASGATGGHSRRAEIQSICDGLGLETVSIRPYNNCHTVQWSAGLGDTLVAISNSSNMIDARRIIAAAAGIQLIRQPRPENLPSESTMARFKTAIATGATGSSDTATGGTSFGKPPLAE